MIRLLISVLLVCITLSFGCSTTNQNKRKYYRKHTLDTKDRNDRLIKHMGTNPTKTNKKKKKNKYK